VQHSVANKYLKQTKIQNLTFFLLKKKYNTLHVSFFVVHHMNQVSEDGRRILNLRRTLAVQSEAVARAECELFGASGDTSSQGASTPSRQYKTIQTFMKIHVFLFTLTHANLSFALCILHFNYFFFFSLNSLF